MRRGQRVSEGKANVHCCFPHTNKTQSQSCKARGGVREDAEVWVGGQVREVRCCVVAAAAVLHVGMKTTLSMSGY